MGRVLSVRPSSMQCRYRQSQMIVPSPFVTHISRQEQRRREVAQLERLIGMSCILSLRLGPSLLGGGVWTAIVRASSTGATVAALMQRLRGLRRADGSRRVGASAPCGIDGSTIMPTMPTCGWPRQLPSSNDALLGWRGKSW